MDHRPLVSIIVPTRNRRAYLETTLASVRRQSYERWELVVVDDASEDDTGEWLATQTGERLRTLRMSENVGSTMTRNRGLAESRGELCLFLDDDDLLPETALETHVAALSAHPDAIGTLGTVGRIDADGRRLPGEMRPSPRRRVLPDVWRDVLFWWTYLVGASMFRRCDLEAIGGFDESIVFYGDDVDLWLRIGVRGDVVLLPEIVLDYRSHSQTRPDDYVDLLTEMRRERLGAWPSRRRAEAERIFTAGLALGALRLRSGERGNWRRLARLLSRCARVPRLLFSPLSAAEIRRAVARDLALDPWLARLRRR